MRAQVCCNKMNFDNALRCRWVGVTQHFFSKLRADCESGCTVLHASCFIADEYRRRLETYRVRALKQKYPNKGSPPYSECLWGRFKEP